MRLLITYITANLFSAYSRKAFRTADCKYQETRNNQVIVLFNDVCQYPLHLQWKCRWLSVRVIQNGKSLKVSINIPIRIWCAIKKGPCVICEPYVICGQRRPWDQGLRCPLTKSRDIVVRVMSTNRECPDQTARMHMLIWTFAVGIWQKSLFLTLRIIYLSHGSRKVVFVWSNILALFFYYFAMKAYIFAMLNLQVFSIY